MGCVTRVVFSMLLCLLCVSSAWAQGPVVNISHGGDVQPVRVAFGLPGGVPVWYTPDGGGYVVFPSGSGALAGWLPGDGVLGVEYAGSYYTVDPFSLPGFPGGAGGELQFLQVHFQPRGAEYGVTLYGEWAESGGGYSSSSGNEGEGVTSGNPFLPSPGAAALLSLGLLTLSRRSRSLL